MASRRKRKDRNKATSPGRGETQESRPAPNWPVLALALAGLLLAGYLTASAWFGVEPAFCGVDSSCDVVQSSRWGTFLAVPTAFWGMLIYLSIAYTAWRQGSSARRWKTLWMLSSLGLAHSLYLTVISITVIETTCGYCLASLAVMAAIFITVVVQRPGGLENFSWPSWAGQTALVAAVLIGVMHAHYSGVFDPASGPEDPYLKGLAEHLEKSGAIFYGAYW